MSWGAKLQSAFSSVRTRPKFRRFEYRYRSLPSAPSSISSRSLRTAGWYSSTWPTIRIRCRAAARSTTFSASATADGQWLLDQDVLAGVERVQRERGVRDGRRRDHDAGDVVAREDVVRVGRAA